MLSPALAAAEPSKDIRKEAAEVTKSLEVQPDLPNDANRSESDPQPMKGWGMSGGPGRLVEAPAAIWRAIGWPLIVLAAGIALAVLLSWLWEGWSRRQPAIEAATAESDEIRAPAPDPVHLLQLAEECAAAAHYADAIHYVLLAAIALVTRKLGSAAPDSLTGRELVRVQGIEPPQRQELRYLVERVEQAWFGRRPVELADYLAARTAFQSFSSSAERA